MRRLWSLLVHGRIEANVGWCGQDGYWWVRPCPHYHVEEMAPGEGGCHWLDIDRIRKVAVLEYRMSLDPSTEEDIETSPPSARQASQVTSQPTEGGEQIEQFAQSENHPSTEEET